jgi:hypothetical protein
MPRSARTDDEEKVPVHCLVPVRPGKDSPARLHDLTRGVGDRPN